MGLVQLCPELKPLISFSAIDGGRLSRLSVTHSLLPNHGFAPIHLRPLARFVDISTCALSPALQKLTLA